MNPKAPWADFCGSSEIDHIPHMLSLEEMSYLSWLAQEKIGELDVVVEIGPWLGMSTRLLTYGKNFRRSVLTIDDFIWRSVWMDGYLHTPDLPKNGDSFLDLFRSLNQDYLQYLNIMNRRLNVYDGNDAVPPLQKWELPKKIDVLFIDCGRTLEVNETWWNLVKNSLVPSESLIVMQNWRLWRETPQRWFNQTLIFTDSHSENLLPLHEVSDGGLASFIYV
jgi:hypothetical protein